MVGTLISTFGKDEGLICSVSRSLIKARPLALPPIAPVPICVQRNAPCQNLRSKSGSSDVKILVPLMHTSSDAGEGCAFLKLLARLHPASVVACLCDTANRDRVGRISHVQFLSACQIRHCKIRRRHL